MAVVPAILKGLPGHRITNLPLHVTVTTVASLARTCPAAHGEGEPGNAWGRCNGRCPGVSSAAATSPSVGAAQRPASVSRAGHLPLVAASREVLRHCGGRRGHPVSGCPWYERGPRAGTMMSSAFERSHGENGHCPKRPRGRGSFMATRHRESPG